MGQGLAPSVAYASQETAATFSIGEENENLDRGNISDRDMRPSYWNCPRSRSERPVGSQQSNVRSTSRFKIKHLGQVVQEF